MNYIFFETTIDTFCLNSIINIYTINLSDLLYKLLKRKDDLKCPTKKRLNKTQN